MTAVLLPHSQSNNLLSSNSKMMSVDASPPHSPFYNSSSSLSWNTGCSSSARSLETTVTADYKPQPSNQKDDTNPAKVAVVAMGLPEEIVQLAIDIRLLDEGTSFRNAAELLLAVDILCYDLEKQAASRRRVYEHSQNQGQKQCKQVPSLVLPAQTKQLDLEKPPAKILDDLQNNAKKPVDTLVETPKKDQAPNCASTGSAKLSAEMSKGADTITQAGQKSEGQTRVHHLARENQRLKERKLCRACRKVELSASGITFLPCGHFITCETCSEMFDDCPACGKNIMGTVRTFLS